MVPRWGPAADRPFAGELLDGVEGLAEEALLCGAVERSIQLVDPSVHPDLVQVRGVDHVGLFRGELETPSREEEGRRDVLSVEQAHDAG